jgi:2-C-methyl-D-erythritol 4-phosphate cytidylyltransferase
LPRDVAVLLVAAGKGERAGGGVPKQFRPIGGVPMLLRAVRPFASHPDVDEVVVALPGAVLERLPDWLAGLGGDRLSFVAGGESRRASVVRALSALRGAARVILVHDAARPFVSRETIDAVIATVREGDTAVAAVPLSDTLKRADADQVVTGTERRDGLWRAQTPQGFPRAVLESAHARADMAAPVTDDAMLVESMGHRVRLVPDPVLNFKVTTADDFVLADALAAQLA